jgi:hypothetical protein
MKRSTIFFAFIATLTAYGQEAYEIQVYASNTMPKKSMIVELHSNASAVGPRANKSFRPVHETLEVTAGIADNFEFGFYVFTRTNKGRVQYVGNNIRPRVMAPAKWKLPVGLSLSAEIGFEKDPDSSITNWGMEIRPIVDKTIGNWYFSFNPNFEKVFQSGSAFEFTPNLKLYYLINKVAAGFEYYGNVGNAAEWLPGNQQFHQLYGVIDLFTDPRLEFNLGIGRGLTNVSDTWNIKLLLGWRIKWK